MKNGLEVSKEKLKNLNSHLSSELSTQSKIAILELKNEGEKFKDMTKIGERQIRFCKKTNSKVKMEYVGKGQGCDDSDGWLCLHCAEDKIVEIKIGYPKSGIDELRKAFSVPEKYPDEELLEVLVSNLVDRYLDVEYFLPEDVQNLLTDVIAERWLK